MHTATNSMEKDNMRFENQEQTPKHVEASGVRRARSERGFTLLEIVLAMLVMMIAVLGTMSLFIFSVNYNSGSRARAMALAVAQRHLERLRNVPFDNALLNATTTTPTPVRVDSYGRSYAVTTVITNAPGALPNPATSTRRKTITVTVRPAGGRTTNGTVEWSFAPVSLTTTRTSLKVGDYMQ
jgi:type IV pilus assembly protein PilV